ncbi:MAG: M14 family metallopeptidase [Actinomycetota bacterium]|nr:M14 family metallopeptidase [Actinomycetota bacterium]
MQRLLASIACAALTTAALVLPAAASPVCDDEPREACGGRIFPEAENTVSFLQHDNGEYLGGLEALEEEHPRFIRVRTVSEFLGREALSAGRRELILVEVTDFNVPADEKVTVAASIGVHGNERAGVEGAARYIEDIVNWADDEPDHELANGTLKDSITIGARAALGKVHIYLSAINPDGWAAGDAQNGGVFSRGNANGVDLNRQFPTKGWTNTGRALALTEPEPKAWDKLVRRIDPVMSVDLHGELTSANNAFADIMLPAGQWNPTEQERHNDLARHMKSNIERWFELQGVEMDTFTGPAGQKPAEYATGFDVVGYDDSGFMGDWFTEQIGTVDLDVEHFFSHFVPNSTWVASLEDAHIASVRGELETIIVEAPLIDRTRPILRLGGVGYLFDPKVTKSSDGYGGPKPPEGVDPQPYHATRMSYFEDLSRFATIPFKKVWSNAVRTGLETLDTFVIADRPFPRTKSGRKPVAERVARQLEAFVRRGGNLILTDRAVRLLGRLDVVPKRQVRKDIHGAGHINIEDFEDPYMADVHTTASQTYYEVPLGFTLETDSSPHWTVDRATWEEAGGKTIAYVEDEERVGVGRIELGRGTIGIFGAVLPQPTERFDHLYGVADYAVTVAGGQILNNMIAYALR